MFETLIKNARVIDTTNDLDGEFDVAISGGKVAAVDKPSSIDGATKTIDAKGCFLLPGLIDIHTHLREPGETHKETILSGSRAAVAGGFTTIGCMANTRPTNDSAKVTKDIVAKSREALCKVHPIGAVSKGLKGQELAEIGGMVQEGAIAISDDGMPVMNSQLMRQAMEYAKGFGIPVVSHSEDMALSKGRPMNEGKTSFDLGLKGNPSASEEILVAREIALSRLTGCRVHIAHISSRFALQHVLRAKEEGLPVTCEVTPHHLLLTDESVGLYDTHCKMAPPLRSQEDVAAMQEGVKTGLIDLIATDHAPHSPLEKNLPFESAAFGITGLETVLPLLVKLSEETFGLKRLIHSLTTAPKALFGVGEGQIKVGGDADICLFDPNEEWTLESKDFFSKSKNHPFVGKKLRGRMKATFVGGRLVYDR